MTDELEQDAAPEDLRVVVARMEAAEASMRERLLRAEMKVHAVRAGMVDLDGLKLMDLGGLALDEQGEVAGAEARMAELRRAKPWLFRGASSSSLAAAPPAHPPRGRMATEMDEAEWRAARTEMLRRA